MKTRYLMLALTGGLAIPGSVRGQQIAEGYYYDAPSEARKGYLESHEGRPE